MSPILSWRRRPHRHKLWGSEPAGIARPLLLLLAWPVSVYYGTYTRNVVSVPHGRGSTINATEPFCDESHLRCCGIGISKRLIRGEADANGPLRRSVDAGTGQPHHWSIPRSKCARLPYREAHGELYVTVGVLSKGRGRRPGHAGYGSMYLNCLMSRQRQERLRWLAGGELLCTAVRTSTYLVELGHQLETNVPISSHWVLLQNLVWVKSPSRLSRLACQLAHPPVQDFPYSGGVTFFHLASTTTNSPGYILMRNFTLLSCRTIFFSLSFH